MANSNKFIKRYLFDSINQHLTNNKEITVIIGPRQVGKTVLLEQLREFLVQEKKVDPKTVFYFNLDIIKDRELFQDQAELIEFIKQRSQGQKIYLFIDEAQKVKEAGLFFKGVYDAGLKAKLILTGSSTLEIKAKIHEPLTGRKRVFYLLPLSFAEILAWRDSALFNLINQRKELIAHDQAELVKHFTDYCIWGGYPQAVMAQGADERQNYLNEIFTSYVERDIVGFLKVENEGNFVKLVRLLAGQIGALINVGELSSLVNTDRYTIDRYLLNLEKTYIIYNLKPFYTNARQEIVKAAKVYFFDNGLRNLSLETLDGPFAKRMDKGSLLENAVLKELLVLKFSKRFNIKFWRSKQKAEVDFIIERGLEITPVEVKASLTSQKLNASLLGFIERYQPAKALVINLGLQGSRKVKNTQVFFIQPWELGHYL